MADTDYNDLAARAGPAEVRRQLAKAVPAVQDGPAAGPREQDGPVTPGAADDGA